MLGFRSAHGLEDRQAATWLWHGTLHGGRDLLIDQLHAVAGEEAHLHV